MLTNTILPDANMSHSVSLRSFGSDSFAFRQFADGVIREIPCAEVLLLTTLPRGGLQIAQPQKLAESFEKAYVRIWHTQDDASWKAITTGKPARGKSAGRYVDEFLQMFGYQHSAACAVKDPVLPGYVGVLQLLRTPDQGAFSNEDLEKLAEQASQLSTSLAEIHTSRQLIQQNNSHNAQPTDIRVFVLDANGEPLLSPSSFNQLDGTIREQMVREAGRQTNSLAGEPSTSNRLLLPDAKGDNWTVNAVTYADYSALHTGPVVFFCLLPSCTDWSLLRATDIPADGEMARMVPALRFMQQEYHRGPTLTEIAKTVHLSPFHFHRRFSELFGLTPKHFLLECQLQDAKHELVSGEKELAKIAADCGFAHQSHFTSRFKQATGLTPTRWRRMANSRS